MSLGEVVMRGFLIVRLQEYVQGKFGRDVWLSILQSVGLPTTKLYFSQTSYPDDEFYRIIGESIRLSGMKNDPFFEEFGYSLGPIFLITLKPMLKPEWKAIDILEHIQEFNYHMLQQGEQPVNMGQFNVLRKTNDTIQIEYSSPRQLCHLAIGLFKSIANQLDEELTINQSKCMLHGDAKCILEIKTVPAVKQRLPQFAKLGKSFA